MITGKMIFSRCDGTSIEVVYVEDARQSIKIMEWPEALQFAISILKQVQEIADLPGLNLYIEAHRAK